MKFYVDKIPTPEECPFVKHKFTNHHTHDYYLLCSINGNICMQRSHECLYLKELHQEILYQ